MVESADDDSSEIVNNEHFRKQKKIKKEIFMVFASFQFIPNIFKQLTNNFYKTALRTFSYSHLV